MRRLSLLLAVIGALALAPSASASWSASVKRNGDVYLGMSLRGTLPLGAALAGGMAPACDDVIVIGPEGKRMNPRPSDEPTELSAIAGVPAALAVVRPQDPRTAYLAPGTLP